MLLKTLGGTFIRRKKLPVAIRVAKALKTFNFAKLKAAVTWALHTTTYTIPAGASLTMKIGHAAMSEAMVMENIVAALEGMIPNLPYGGWRNVKSIGLRSSQSITLPVYNQLPDIFVPKELIAYQSSNTQSPTAPTLLSSTTATTTATAAKTATKRAAKTAAKTARTTATTATKAKKATTTTTTTTRGKKEKVKKVGKVGTELNSKVSKAKVLSPSKTATTRSTRSTRAATGIKK